MVDRRLHHRAVGRGPRDRRDPRHASPGAAARRRRARRSVAPMTERPARRDRARHQGLDLDAAGDLPGVRVHGQRGRRSAGRGAGGGPHRSVAGRAGPPRRPSGRAPGPGPRWSTPATSATSAGLHRAGRRMLRDDGPGSRLGPDAAAVAARYHAQDPAPSPRSCATRRPTCATRSRGRGRAVAAHRRAQRRVGVHRRDAGPVLPTTTWRTTLSTWAPEARRRHTRPVPRGSAGWDRGPGHPPRRTSWTGQSGRAAT